jgi:16S rRNA (cytosine967-C5)-methyltransferase
MGISTARRIAYEVLRRVESEGAYASDLLHAELDAEVKREDAALATELTLGVLRLRRLLDFLLERQLRKPVAQLDLPVALALRIGLYQLLFLTRIPARAAVNESVELVKRARKASASSLVNAVLRRAAVRADEPVQNLLPQDASLAERLGILHSHPTWIVERWLTRLGEARTILLLQANDRAPRLSCAMHGTGHRREILRIMQEAGLEVEPGQLLKTAFSVRNGAPTRTEAFRKGWISVQDEASQAVPLLLGVRPGDRVLDLCAAPGGKTPALVRAAGNSGIVVAGDRYAHRIQAMREQFERLGLDEVRLIELDAEKPLPFRIKFDRILVDAPCSGTGTLARHPEIRWRLKPEQLLELHRLQSEMLANALAQLDRRGRLVYSTCSLEREENEDVAREAVSRVPSVRRVPAEEMKRSLEAHIAPGIKMTQLFDESQQFHTMPGELQMDGFFASAFEKI